MVPSSWIASLSLAMTAHDRPDVNRLYPLDCAKIREKRQRSTLATFRINYRDASFYIVELCLSQKAVAARILILFLVCGFAYPSKLANSVSVLVIAIRVRAIKLKTSAIWLRN
jgi:hypothetical protein